MNAFWPAPQELWSIGGEITLVLTVIAVLISPFFALGQSNTLGGIIAIAGLVAALVVTTTVHFPQSETFRGLLVFDPAVRFWKQLLLIFVIGVVFIWFSSTRRSLNESEAPEYFTLLLSSTIGMMLMGGTSNLLMIVLASEIASMPTYILAGIRRTNRRSAEAAIKYVLFGAVSTAIMIYAVSFLYGTHGTLSLAVIADQLHQSQTIPLTTVIGLIGLLVGLLFKLSAVPLHFWSPDVFEGSRVDVAAFLSVASKGAGLVLLMRVSVLFAEVSSTFATGIGVILASIAVVTMTIGNLGALQQTSVKRLLAYSSIAHAGYMLAAVAMVPKPEATTIVGLYLAIYLLMNLGAFAVTAIVEVCSGSDRLVAFRGLAACSPLVAVALGVSLLSMVGLPPMGGFWAKVRLMTLVGSSGGWWWLVVGAIAINSIVSLAFYARVLKPAFLEKGSPNDQPPKWRSLAIITGLATIAAFVFVGPLERACAQFGEQVGIVRQPRDTTYREVR